MRFSKGPTACLIGVVAISMLGAVRIDASKGQSRESRSVVFAREWRSDLETLVAELRRTHPDLFHATSEAEFVEAVAKLDRRIPTLARHEIIVEMARIVAMVGDGHTNLSPIRDPKIGFHGYPLRFALFNDGLFVRCARPDLSRAVGRRVVKIGRMNVEDAIAIVGKIISRDNAMTVRFMVPMYLAIPEVLHALRIVDDVEHATIEVDGPTGPRVVEIAPDGPCAPLPSHTDTTWTIPDGWVDMRPADITPPAWLRELEREHWFETIDGGHAVYAQINAIADSDEETFEAFSRRLMDAVDRSSAERLILDLRRNRGGNGELRSPLIRRLIRSRLNHPGGLFVLVSRATFSAAQFVLDDLEQFTDAVIVGEPAGSKGNSFGDSRKIVLPKSGITVRCSIYWWQDWFPTDSRPWNAPEIAADPGSEQYRKGLDPVVSAALGYRPEPDLASRLRTAIDAGGIPGADAAYRQFCRDPRFTYRGELPGLYGLAIELLEQKRFDESVHVLRIGIDRNPENVEPHVVLGDVLLEIGRREDARREFRRAIEMDSRCFAALDRLTVLGAR